jgi:glycosyltransferase involved in cell wall biosynthesis
MASDLPVVVSTKAGISEFLSNGVDSLVLSEPENPLLLREILSRLAQDPELRQNLAQNATQTAARLS